MEILTCAWHGTFPAFRKYQNSPLFLSIIYKVEMEKKMDSTMSLDRPRTSPGGCGPNSDQVPSIQKGPWLGSIKSYGSNPSYFYFGLN